MGKRTKSQSSPELEELSKELMALKADDEILLQVEEEFAVCKAKDDIDPEIESIQTPLAVLMGDNQTPSIVAKNVDELRVELYQGLPGFRVRKKYKRWFIPLSQVKEVVFKRLPGEVELITKRNEMKRQLDLVIDKIRTEQGRLSAEAVAAQAVLDAAAVAESKKEVVETATP